MQGHLWLGSPWFVDLANDAPPEFDFEPYEEAMSAGAWWRTFLRYDKDESHSILGIKAKGGIAPGLMRWETRLPILIIETPYPPYPPLENVGSGPSSAAAVAGVGPEAPGNVPFPGSGGFPKPPTFGPGPRPGDPGGEGKFVPKFPIEKYPCFFHFELGGQQFVRTSGAVISSIPSSFISTLAPPPVNFDPEPFQSPNPFDPQVINFEGDPPILGGALKALEGPEPALGIALGRNPKRIGKDNFHPCGYPLPRQDIVKKKNITNTLRMWMEQSSTAITFTPTRINEGAFKDLRYNCFPTIEEQQLDILRSPSVGRLEAWGAQLPIKQGWDYLNAPGCARDVGGDTNGGVMFFPPGRSMDGVQTGEVGEHYFAVYGTEQNTTLFGAGTADPSGDNRGLLLNGYSWGLAGDQFNVFRNDAFGSRAEVFNINSDGDTTAARSYVHRTQLDGASAALDYGITSRVQTSLGTFTMTLPTAASLPGRRVTIKDIDGNASTNNITIDTTAAETIDGSATATISANFGVLEFESDGANWYVIENTGMGTGLADPMTTAYDIIYRNAGNTTVRLGVGTDSQTLAVGPDGALEYREAPVERGIHFEWDNVSQVSMVPGGEAGDAVIFVSDGTDNLPIHLTSTLICNLSGALNGIGLLDTGTEGNFGYFVYLLTQNDGASPGLIFSRSSTGSGVTLPASFTHYSRPLFYVYNDSGNDIVEFIARGHNSDVCYYADRLSVLTNGTATVATNIALGETFPTGGDAVMLEIVANNVNATTSSILVRSNAGPATLFFQSLSTAAGRATGTVDLIDAPVFGAKNTALAYFWSAATAGRDVDIFNLGWKWRSD